MVAEEQGDGGWRGGGRKERIGKVGEEEWKKRRKRWKGVGEDGEGEEEQEGEEEMEMEEEERKSRI